MKFRKVHLLELDALTNEERDIFEALPEDYRLFLAKQNGGRLQDSSQASFDVPIVGDWPSGRLDAKRTALEEFWTFVSCMDAEAPVGPDEPASILHEHFFRHDEEQFLPSGTLVIGRCFQDSLVVISMNEADFGAIYYWEWYWQYPWYKNFFLGRVTQAVARFPDVKGPEHPQHAELVDATNYATLVKVASSFDDFFSRLSPAS